MNEDAIKSTVAKCEKYLVVDDLAGFYECTDRAGLSDWSKKEIVLVPSDPGEEIYRALLYKIVGNEVWSIIARYEITDGGAFVYAGFFVDVSDYEDFKRVVGEA